ncbi:MAG TPA: universal stress protein [Solirubrobacteraceae bacterium]|nr:universal stress protein [Solirubrobacteraceae bacterium]
MFKNIVVGVDEAEGGRDAIALAKVLLAGGGQLTLAHVFIEDWLGSRVWTEPILESRKDRARELLERAAEEAAIRPQIRWVGAPSVGRGLHEIAEATAADLLVVGSSRHGLLGRVLVADDTRAALNGAPCAIAVAPAGYGEAPPTVMREIGVAYNGSPESKQALALARDLATELDAEPSAFEVIAVPSLIAHGRVAANEIVIKRLVDEIRKHIKTRYGVEGYASYGEPAEELTLYSASLDLLVVGSRGYGPLGRLVHGSTSQRLARSARCPLLVLTRAAREKAVSTESEERPEAASLAR